MSNSYFKVFEVTGSLENDRPELDFENPLNSRNDWGALDEVLRNQREGEVQAVTLTLAHPEFNKWDYYIVPGTFGLFSQRALKAIPEISIKDFTLFPASLNAMPYFFLKCERERACLDLARSKLETFPSNPSRIMSVSKYAFLPGSLGDPLVFYCAECSELFVTQGVVECWQRAKCNGMRFTEVARAS
jgi:hypothetical protein